MHLVDVHIPLGGMGSLPALLPFLIVPFVAADVKQLAVGSRPGLLMKAVGIGFPDLLPVLPGHNILIGVELLGIFHRQLPHAVLQPVHIPALPAVEITDQRHTAGLWCPYPEHPAAGYGMRAKVFIRPVPHAAGQSITAHLRHLLTYCITVSRRLCQKGDRVSCCIVYQHSTLFSCHRQRKIGVIVKAYRSAETNTPVTPKE